MVFIFLVQEFQVQHERLAPLCRHFFFLDYYPGKGVYLLLLLSLIMQHTYALQWIIAIALLVVITINIVFPCMLNSEPINGLKPRDMLLNQTEKMVEETPDETLKRKLKENG